VHRSRSDMELPREKRGRSYADQVGPNSDGSSFIYATSQPLSSQPPPNQEEYMQRQHDYDRSSRRKENRAVGDGIEGTKATSSKMIERSSAETKREASAAVSEKGAPTDPICLDDDEEDGILYDH